jgi:transcriptional regulator GlxA family with amidase domain
VKIDSEPIYIRDQNIYTSAGVTAGIDLALALVEEDLGSSLALRIAGLDPADVQAIRERQLPSNKRYAALSRLARALIEPRGHLSNEDLTAFIEAGFEPALALEVVAVVAASTITNYAGSITNPPLEVPFQKYTWRG